MERIALVQLGYESNTFAGTRAVLEDLAPDGWIAADTVLSRFRGSRTGIGGVLQAVEEAGGSVVPMDLLSRGGAFNAGGVVDDAFWRHAVGRICRQLRERAAEYDGVCIAMHGAACTERLDDADGWFLQQVRAVAGDKPVAAFLDLHAIITPRMLAAADVLLGVKTYPHVDFYETGLQTARILLAQLRGERTWEMAWQPLPMLVPATFSSTLQGTGREIRTYVEDRARAYGLADATFFHGFAAADTAETCACVVAVGEGEAPHRAVKEMARHIWQLRHGFMQPCYTAAQAVDVALASVRSGYAVIHEPSDNPGGGCPGDGTHLLRELLERNVEGAIFGVLYDPTAAACCHDVGVGAKVRLSLGGHTLPIFGEPLEVEAEVLALCDGQFVCASPMYQGLALGYGPTARIRCGVVEVVLVSRRMQSYDDRPLLMTGARMEDYRLVALKSTNHFRAFFKDTADAIITAETPGLFPADIRTLDYCKVCRPIFPLDEDATFEE